MADAAAVSPRIPNSLITLFNSGNPAFSNGLKSLPSNPPSCIILDNCVFDNLISVDVWLAKALRRFVPYLLVSNNF